MNNFADFYTVKGIRFDVRKLQEIEKVNGLED